MGLVALQCESQIEVFNLGSLQAPLAGLSGQEAVEDSKAQGQATRTEAQKIG